VTPGAFIRTILSQGCLRNRDYLIVPDPAAERSSAETYLATGEHFARLEAGMVDDAFENGRISNVAAAAIVRLIRRNQWAEAVLDAAGRLLGWSFVSRDLPTGSLGGITVHPGDGFVYIHDTYVLDDSRGRRLGAALNLRMIETFADRKLFCLTPAGNIPALSNWNRCGARSLARISETRLIGCGWRQRVERLAAPAEADPYLARITFKR